LTSRFIGKVVGSREEAVKAGARSSGRSRSVRRSVDRTGTSPSIGRSSRLWIVVSIGHTRLVPDVKFLVVLIFLLLVVFFVFVLERFAVIFIREFLLSPAFYVLSERPEEVASKLPDHSTVFASSPWYEPEECSYDDTGET
jgi:hypothetical protein